MTTVVIPTIQRPHCQPVLDKFTSIGVYPLLLVQSKRDVPPGYKHWTAVPAQGIRAVRQWAYENIEGNYWMFDDDLRIGRRTPDNKITYEFDFRDFVEDCSAINHEYGLSGVHPRFMINNALHRVVLNSKMYHVMMFNRELLEGFDLEYRLETGEDHDFHLQYLTQGGTSALLSDWCHEDKENAPGGCAVWRNNVLQDVDELISNWPQFVRKNKAGRPVIQFKKAHKQGQRFKDAT